MNRGVTVGFDDVGGGLTTSVLVAWGVELGSIVGVGVSVRVAVGSTAACWLPEPPLLKKIAGARQQKRTAKIAPSAMRMNFCWRVIPAGSGPNPNPFIKRDYTPKRVIR